MPFLCQNLSSVGWVALRDEHGGKLAGIRGKRGVAAASAGGPEFGIDLIEMAPGAAFPLHTHDGDHILYVVEGRGVVHVDGVDHLARPGDTIFISARYPHGVRAHSARSERLVFLAVGYPYRPVGATDRMKLVPQEESE
jgi:quercetin dioxygenase-like cupin family protein